MHIVTNYFLDFTFVASLFQNPKKSGNIKNFKSYIRGVNLLDEFKHCDGANSKASFLYLFQPILAMCCCLVSSAVTMP